MECWLALVLLQGHLITDSVFQNYRLEIEYRFLGIPGNCGVLVHASKPRALYKMFPKSIEVQMMHENAGDFWCIAEDIKTDNMIERRGPEEKIGVLQKVRRGELRTLPMVLKNHLENGIQCV